MERISLAGLYNSSFNENWELPMLSDQGGEIFKYKDVALTIHTLAVMFEKAGLKKGDKIAIYGRNSANWGKIFLAGLSYGLIIVPILPDFKPENVHNIINHSETHILFAAKQLFDTLNLNEMEGLECTISLEDFSVLNCRNEALQPLPLEALEMMKTGVVNKETFAFGENEMENVQVLSYTSGSTGFSKGVMIPVRSIYSNLIFAQDKMPLKSKDRIVSFLPMSHVFGLLFEFLFPVTVGCHITFLNKTPSAQVLVNSFKEVKPRLILSVPLVIEKIYKKSILPTIQKPVMKILLHTPLINSVLHKKICGKLIETFGANFMEIVIGGAALTSDIELFFRKIKFPFTVGYGMTECGPLISYAKWDVSRPFSSGQLVDRMEVRIDSDDPYNTVGEIQLKGMNVMLGYYKNDDANKNSFTDDGWLRTGDLGVIDKDNFIYIKGRSKNMLLGPSGQNIYPEELEARLSNMPYVQECVVIQRGAKLVALVYPDKEALKNNHRNESMLEDLMAENRKHFNHEVSSYEQLTKIEIVETEFEKTPKSSIKRFLYM